MNRKHFISAILALTVSAVLMYISLGLSQIRPDTILAPVLAGISMVVMIGVAFASASGPRSIALAVIIAVVAVALAAGVATASIASSSILAEETVPPAEEETPVVPEEPVVEEPVTVPSEPVIEEPVVVEDEVRIPAPPVISVDSASLAVDPVVPEPPSVSFETEMTETLTVPEVPTVFITIYPDKAV